MVHVFNIDLAERLGIEKAIMIEQIYFWVHKNECDDIEEMNIDGRTWCRSSAKGFSKYIPYMTPKKIWRVLKELVEVDEILLSGNFNKKATNQTLWYAFSDKFIEVAENYGYHFPKMENAISKNGKCNNSLINNPIIEEEKIKEENKSLSNDKPKSGIPFTDFYDKYPLKKQKAIAEKRWYKLSAKDRKAAIDNLEDYINDCIENDRSYQYPSTYINKHTWEDFATEEKKESEIPADDIVPWANCQAWMQTFTPKLFKVVKYDDFARMRGYAHFDGSIFAAIVKQIEANGHDGDIVKEFERIYDNDYRNMGDE